jgi:hypothetical protein
MVTMQESEVKTMEQIDSLWTNRAIAGILANVGVFIATGFPVT